MKFFFALLVYGFLLGMPIYFLFFLVPILNEAHNLNVSAQDISVYELRSEARFHFKDYYRDKIPAEKQKAYLLERFGGKTKFGRDVWHALIDWGGQIVQEETGAENAPEEKAVRAALDRIKGSDQKSKKAETVYERFKRDFPLRDDKRYARNVMILLHLFYPNDDIAYLAFESAWSKPELKLVNNDFWFGFWCIVVGTALWGLLVQRGMRLLSLSSLGWILGLQHDPIFRDYKKAMFNPWRQLLAFALVFPFSWWLATTFIEPFYVLYFPNENCLFLAIFWNALMGGVLVESLENVITLFVIRAGHNPHRIIWDNALVVIVWVGVLLYFQNSWFSIASAVSLGLSMNFLHKAFAYREESKLARVQENNEKSFGQYESCPRKEEYNPRHDRRRRPL